MGLRPTDVAFYYLLTFLISHLLNFHVKALLREKLQESVVSNLQRGLSPGARICNGVLQFRGVAGCLLGQDIHYQSNVFNAISGKVLKTIRKIIIE